VTTLILQADKRDSHAPPVVYYPRANSEQGCEAAGGFYEWLNGSSIAVQANVDPEQKKTPRCGIDMFNCYVQLTNVKNALAASPQGQSLLLFN